MALQVEFGDFSHDIHEDIYFNLEHYLPSHIIKNDVENLRSSLVKLHKAHLGKFEANLQTILVCGYIAIEGCNKRIT